MRTLNLLVAWTCVLGLAMRANAQEDAAVLARQLDASDVETRLNACRELARLGVKAHVAVPQLTKALQAGDAAQQRLAALALASVGPAAADAVPALAERLTADDAQVRAAAAYALGKLGPAAQAAVKPLVRAFADKDEMVRRQARGALHSIGAPSEVVVPLFVQTLEAASPADAAAVIHTLVEIGEPAVPGLIKALDNPDAAYWACLALSELGPQAAPAVPALGKLLGSKESETRAEALMALAAIGKPAQVLVPQIVERAKQQDELPAVRYAAVYALGTIGDKAAGPALSAMMDHDDAFLRVAAAWAYLRITEGEKSPEVKKAVSIVVAGATSSDAQVRRAAVQALADGDVPPELAKPAFQQALLGIEDPERLLEIVDSLAQLGPRVVPMCVQSLEEKGPLRYYAMQLLSRLGEAAAPARDALTKTLQDPSPELRREALFALGALGPAAAPSLEAVVVALADEDADVRHTACYALGKMGPAAAAALPKLQAAWTSEDAFLRIAAAWAALKVAPQNEDVKRQVVPHLTKGLADEREHVRLECAYALGELGAVAKSAIPALQQAQAEDDSDDVRTAAGDALKMLGKEGPSR
jgi:HEAT repeat protein